MYLKPVDFSFRHRVAMIGKSWDHRMHWDRAGATAASIVQDWRALHGPGGAILGFDSKDIRVSAAGGMADLAHNVAFGTGTAIRYASVSKHFLNCVLLGGAPVGYDDALGRHLALPEAAAGVTVGRALDMTGGLPDLVETLWLLGIPAATNMNRHRLMDAMQLMGRLNFSPGTEISYSNTGYRLVQAALMAKGVDYRGVLHDRLFRPLGLGIRLPEDETEPVPALATGYRRGLDGWHVGLYGMHFSASGGLAGTGDDLARWGQALLAGSGPLAGMLDRLTPLRHLEDGRPTAYGLGLARVAFDGRTLFGHGGSLPGYRSHLLLDPASGTGVAVLCNREDSDAGMIALRVMAALHNAPLLPTATALLPEGLFLAEDGPYWLQHRAGQASFMGAAETLIDGGDGWAVNRSAPLPMRLRAEGPDIVGEVGHVRRHFRPVPPRAAPDPDWAGQYVAIVDPPSGQTMSIEVTVQRGMACLHMPPLGQRVDLRPLDASRAVAQRIDGPWTQPLCVVFDRDALTLATQRSRILRFSRA